MNTKLEDFIWSCCEFNGCNFCNEFGFRKNCPLKNAYSDGHEPSDEEVSANSLICKKFVLSSFNSLISKNQ